MAYTGDKDKKKRIYGLNPPVVRAEDYNPTERHKTYSFKDIPNIGNKYHNNDITNITSHEIPDLKSYFHRFHGYSDGNNTYSDFDALAKKYESRGLKGKEGIKAFMKDSKDLSESISGTDPKNLKTVLDAMPYNPVASHVSRNLELGHKDRVDKTLSTIDRIGKGNLFPDTPKPIPDRFEQEYKYDRRPSPTEPEIGNALFPEEAYEKYEKPLYGKEYTNSVDPNKYTEKWAYDEAVRKAQTTAYDQRVRKENQGFDPITTGELPHLSSSQRGSSYTPHPIDIEDLYDYTNRHLRAVKAPEASGMEYELMGGRYHNETKSDFSLNEYKGKEGLLKTSNEAADILNDVLLAGKSPEDLDHIRSVIESTPDKRGLLRSVYKDLGGGMDKYNKSMVVSRLKNLARGKFVPSLAGALTIPLSLYGASARAANSDYREAVEADYNESRKDSPEWAVAKYMAGFTPPGMLYNIGKNAYKSYTSSNPNSSSYYAQEALAGVPVVGSVVDMLSNSSGRSSTPYKGPVQKPDATKVATPVVPNYNPIRTNSLPTLPPSMRPAFMNDEKTKSSQTAITNKKGKRSTTYSMGTQRINLQDPYKLPKYGYGSMGVYQQDVPEYQDVDAFNTGKKRTIGKAVGTGIGSAIGALGYLIPYAGAAVGPVTTALGGMAGGAIGGKVGANKDARDARGSFNSYNTTRSNVLGFNRNQRANPIMTEQSSMPFRPGIDGNQIQNNQPLMNNNAMADGAMFGTGQAPFQNRTRQYQPWIDPNQFIGAAQGIGGAFAGGMGGGMSGGMGQPQGGTPMSGSGGGFAGRMQGMFGNGGMFFNRRNGAAQGQQTGISPMGSSNAMPNFFQPYGGNRSRQQDFMGGGGYGYYAEGSKKVAIENAPDYGNKMPFQQAFNQARQKGDFFFKWNGQAYNAMSAEEANYLKQQVKGNATEGYSGDPNYDTAADNYGTQALKYAMDTNEGPGSNIYGNLQNQFNANRQAGKGMQYIPPTSTTPTPKAQDPTTQGIILPEVSITPNNIATPNSSVSITGYIEGYRPTINTPDPYFSTLTGKQNSWGTEDAEGQRSWSNRQSSNITGKDMVEGKDAESRYHNRLLHELIESTGEVTGREIVNIATERYGIKENKVLQVLDSLIADGKVDKIDRGSDFILKKKTSYSRGTRLVAPYRYVYADGSSKIYGKKAYQQYVTNTAKDYNSYPDMPSAYNAAKQAGDQYFMHGNQPYYVDQAKSQADLAKYTNMYSYMDNPVQTGQSIQNSPNQFDNMPLSMNMPPIHTTAVESTQGMPPMDSGTVYRMNNPVPNEVGIPEGANATAQLPNYDFNKGNAMYSRFLNDTYTPPIVDTTAANGTNAQPYNAGGSTIPESVGNTVGNSNAAPLQGGMNGPPARNQVSSTLPSNMEGIWGMNEDEGTGSPANTGKFSNYRFPSNVPIGTTFNDSLDFVHNNFFGSQFYREAGKDMADKETWKDYMNKSLDMSHNPYYLPYSIVGENGTVPRGDTKVRPIDYNRSRGEFGHQGPIHMAPEWEGRLNAGGDPTNWGYTKQGERNARTHKQWAETVDHFQAAEERDQMGKRGEGYGTSEDRFVVHPLEALNRHDLSRVSGVDPYPLRYPNFNKRDEVRSIQDLFYDSMGYRPGNPLDVGKTQKRNPKNDIFKMEKGSSSILPFENPLSRDAKPSKEALVEAGELILHRYEKPTKKGVSLKFDLIEDVKGERHSGPNGGERRTLFQDDVIVPRNQRSKFLKHYKSGNIKAIERERLKLPEDKPQYGGGVRTLDIRNSPTYGNPKPIPTNLQPPYRGVNPSFNNSPLDTLGGKRLSGNIFPKGTVYYSEEEAYPQPVVDQQPVVPYPETDPIATRTFVNPYATGDTQPQEPTAPVASTPTTGTVSQEEQPFDFGNYPAYRNHMFIPNMNYDFREPQTAARLQTQPMIPTYMGYQDRGAPDRRLMEEQMNQQLNQIEQSGGSESQRQVMRQQVMDNQNKAYMGLASQTGQRVDAVNQANMQAANQAAGTNAQLFQQTKQMQLAENARASQFNDQIQDNNMDLTNRNYEGAMNTMQSNNLSRNQHDFNAWAYGQRSNLDKYMFDRQQKFYNQAVEAKRPVTDEEKRTATTNVAGSQPTGTPYESPNIFNTSIANDPYMQNLSRIAFLPEAERKKFLTQYKFNLNR